MIRELGRDWEDSDKKLERQGVYRQESDKRVRERLVGYYILHIKYYMFT